MDGWMDVSFDKKVGYSTCDGIVFCDRITLHETNIFAPENGWLEYDRFLLGWPIFTGYVSFREGMLKYPSISF